MEFKFEKAITELGFTFGYPNDAKEITDDIHSYRFVIDKDHLDDSYLPNILFDHKYKGPFNYLKAKPEKILSRCGISLYRDKEKAITSWKFLSNANKISKEYKNLAAGTIKNNDGINTTFDNNTHFGFYESVSCGIEKKFEIIEPLPL
jgi:hypothetical protein